MSPFNAGEFTDMDGKVIEEAGEPLSCPFCGSGADQLIVERWSEEDDPDGSYHVECLKCLQRPSGRDAARGSAGMERAVDSSPPTALLCDTSDAL